MSESLADRARAAATARRERREAEEKAREEAEQRRKQQVGDALKAPRARAYNQQLSALLGEPVNLDWKWNTDIQVVSDHEIRAAELRTELFLRALVEDGVYIEAHENSYNGAKVTFRVESGGSSSPLNNLEDLGDALLTAKNPHSREW